MAYSQGGLIEASDYNGFNGGSSGANVSGQINTVWGIGNGNAGYGQTTGANVAVGNTVTATEWATLINNLNNARKHQAGGSYTNLTAPVAGNKVDYISTLSSRLTDAYTNRLNFNSTRGTTITGSDDITSYSVGATTALNRNRTATITFSSTDKARYFFNAGGALSFFCTAVDNASTNRSNALQACIGILPSSGLQYMQNVGAYDNGGSYLYTTRNLNLGYYNAPTGWWAGAGSMAIYYNVGVYSTTYAQIVCDNGTSTTSGNATSPDTTRGANNNIIRIRLNMYGPADDIYGGSINITVTCRVDIKPPETTYLTDSWSTPTITWSETSQ